MLISYRWLGRHIDLSGISPQDVVDDLMLHTAEVESLEPFAPWLSDVVVGHVIERTKHADADKLSVCRVDVGDANPDGPGALQIVCGAPNVAAGQKVAVGRVGTVLPGDLKLKKAKIRGVESRGMICSERELELGDEHGGIWVLPDDAEIGQPVAAALDAEDWVLEIDNKSLTHRPDLWGHRGIASEIAAVRGMKLLPLDLTLPATGPGDPYPVRVETDGCSRYIGLPIGNVRVEGSPNWLKFLLLATGQRPLDLLVDLSNFVMLDLAQPNHLFDLTLLSPEGIVVRDARVGEKMATLDDVERTFTAEDMLICTGDAPIAVAGVMGGEGSKVAPDTSELLLEVACFHPTTVRRTSSRLGLRTDASTRFEKNLDPTLPAKAAAHLVNTLRGIQPDITLPRQMGDGGTWTDPSCTVGLRPERARAVLGAPISDEEIGAILARLGFGVQGGDPWQITVPSARATKDIGIEEDLIEEIGRMYGYGRIAETALMGELVPAAFDERRRLVRVIQDHLAGAGRFHEALTHSFQRTELLTMLGVQDEPHICVVNPQIEDYDHVRRSVLPSLLGVLELNCRHHEEARLFEVGKGYIPADPSRSTGRGEPRELHQVAIVWAAPHPDKGARFDAGVFARLQGVLEDLFRAVARPIPGWTRAEDESAPAWAHPGKLVRARLSQDGEPAAVLAALEPGLKQRLGLTGELERDVACAVVSVDALLAVASTAHDYRPIPRFPGVKVDVALAVDESVPAGDIAQTIERAGKGLVESLELFDLYRGESVGAGKKSLAYHVTLRARDKTLTDKESAKFLSRLERAVDGLGGELRKE